ncbi:iron ABC transporter permease [Egicoccus halophilus]|uniref:Iron ABC transporter permease n=1 Tax=Egicoccus halophilus TaxID=1670830 RepID=A0A8J3EXY3_9ACTN|nr:iron ABC transporter permease [Egicoccus halophilus]
MTLRERAARWLPFTVPALFLAVFFVLPAGTIVLTGLRPEGRLDLGTLPRVLSDPGTLRVAWFTLWQAAASTALTLVLGLPGAYALTRLRFRGRAALRAAVMVPFVLPTVVVGSAFLALLGPRSPVNAASVALLGEAAPTLDLRRTVTAILLAHVFFNYAVVVRSVGGLWEHLDPRLEDAARTLGASRWRVFREVSWPLLRPAVASSAAIVFLFTFTSFGVVLILGGPGRATIEVEIYRATVQLLNLPLASVLALLQLAAVTAALVAYGRLQRRVTRQPLRSAGSTARPPRTVGERLFLAVNLAVIVLLVLAPLLVLVERSLAVDGGYGFAHYRALFSDQRSTVLAVAPLEAIRNSVVFGLAAALVALVVGGCAATAASRPGRAGRVLDRALMLPLGTSAATVGFGFLLALARPPLDLRGSLLLVPAAQALIATPFVVRTLLPVLRSIDQRLRDAAATLGATPRRVWREVDLPIVGRAVLAAVGFSFAIAVGEFGATVFLARGQTPTMPVAIFRLLGRPGVANFGQAMAMSTILMFVTASAVAVLDRLRVGQVGRF